MSRFALPPWTCIMGEPLSSGLFCPTNGRGILIALYFASFDFQGVIVLKWYRRIWVLFLGSWPRASCLWLSSGCPRNPCSMWPGRDWPGTQAIWHGTERWARHASWGAHFERAREHMAAYVSAQSSQPAMNKRFSSPLIYLIFCMFQDCFLFSIISCNI